MRPKMWVCLAMTVLLVAPLVSCARFKKHPERDSAKATPVAEAAPANRTTPDYDADLRQTVERCIESASRNATRQQTDVTRRTPYFYRQYEVYPDGPGAFKLVIQERESHSVPYIADVTLAKQRYVTRLHRERKDAIADASFLRETGTETLTFEWRGGRWVRVGSLFVAAKTEENVNGEWVPPKETVKRTIAAEEEKSKGWLGRTWSRLLGKKGDDAKIQEAGDAASTP